MNTKTKTIEREPTGHYEIRRGDCWETTAEMWVKHVMGTMPDGATACMRALRAGVILVTPAAHYRYVKD